MAAVVRQCLDGPGRACQEFEDVDAVVRRDCIDTAQALCGCAGLAAAHLGLTHSQRGGEIRLRVTARVQEGGDSRPDSLIQAHTHKATLAHSKNHQCELRMIPFRWLLWNQGDCPTHAKGPPQGRPYTGQVDVGPTPSIPA